jgi:hypothetical protein
MARAKKQSGKQAGKTSAGLGAGERRCGLCGKSKQLTRTVCCGNWICDDEENYVLFSYARNSCYRNHRNFTLCGYHHAEQHTGDWKACATCRGEFDTEDYVGFGTSEYNFEKLENPPAFEPTRCSTCGMIIRRAEGGYTMRSKEFFCHSCEPIVIPHRMGAAPAASSSPSRTGPAPLRPKRRSKRTPRS